MSLDEAQQHLDYMLSHAGGDAIGPVNRQAIARLRREVTLVQEQVAAHEQRIDQIKSVGFVKAEATARGGLHLQVTVAQEVMQTVAESARTLLDGSGAENYREMQFQDAQGLVTLTLQRPGKLTPHSAREQAETRASAAETRGAALVAALDEIVRTSECRCALTPEQACPRCIATDALARTASPLA